MPFPKLFKKAWEKEVCTFEIQEVSGAKGWVSVTEPTGAPPSKQESAEYFKPGNHYRCIARYTEGDHAGQYAGVVWSHYEVHKGLKPREKEAKPKKEEAMLSDPTAVMDKYADQVIHTLEPLGKILGALDMIREQLGGGRGQTAPTPEGTYPSDIPPLEFEGKAPWFIHPYIVKTISEEMKGVIEYGATRLEGILGKPAAPTEEKEEEEPLLPSIGKYTPPSPPAPKAPEGPSEEEEAEEEIEEEEVRVEDLIPCANCGRLVPLLPNGLCQECVDKLTKKEGMLTVPSLVEEEEKPEEEIVAGEAKEPVEEKSEDVELPSFDKKSKRKRK